MDPGLLTNRYQVMRSIGTGAITTVLEARDRLTDTRVAIKVPIGRFANDKAFLVRLEREVATLAGFSHPNVAAVHGVERHGGSGFVVTELVDAPSLREVLAVRGPLRPARAARAAAGMCAALASAHDRGIVHGHLTPDNVLMAGDGHVKLTDFRIAEAARPFATAPNPAADLRALSHCLAAMLTGQEPADGDPLFLSPDVPPELAEIVYRAADDPVDSYATAADLGRDLNRFLVAIHQASVPVDGLGGGPATDPFGAPVTIAPRSTALVRSSVSSSQASAARAARVARPRRRRRLAVAAALVVAAVAIAGSVAAVQRHGGESGTAGIGLAAPALPPLVALTSTTSGAPGTIGLPTTTTKPTTTAPVTAAPTTTSPGAPTTAVVSGLRAVPNVVGLHRQEASGILAQAGLVTQITLAPVPDAGQSQRVISQSPGAGSVVPAGSVVTLVVGSNKPTG